jgi:hypothetical protein
MAVLDSAIRSPRWATRQLQKSEPDRQRGKHREGHLRETARQDLPPHLAEAAERKLDADREQQQDHADFGETFDVLRIGNESEGIGAEQDPGNDKTGQGGELESMKNEND